MTFKPKILWQGKLLDGAVTFILTAPKVVSYKFESFDTEVLGELEVDTALPELAVLDLLSVVTERYINGTVSLRKQCGITIH